MVDVDYVYDYIVRDVKPLNEEALRSSAQEFYVTATDVHTGDSVLLDAKDRIAPVARFLKASSALPVLYNRSVSIAGRSYMDGGVSGGLPIDWAIQQGCTDLLVLLSRTSAYVDPGPRLFERWIFRIMIGLKYPAIYKAFVKAVRVKERNRRVAIGNQQSEGVNIATICPDTAEDDIGRTTMIARSCCAWPIGVRRRCSTALAGIEHFSDQVFEGFRQPGPGK